MVGVHSCRCQRPCAIVAVLLGTLFAVSFGDEDPASATLVITDTSDVSPLLPPHDESDSFVIRPQQSATAEIGSLALVIRPCSNWEPRTSTGRAACLAAAHAGKNVHAAETDWTRSVSMWCSLSVPVIAALLAASIHRPSLAVLPNPNGDEGFGGSVEDRLPRLHQLALLLAPSIVFLPLGGPHWGASQVPLLFAFLGYALSGAKTPRALLLAPLAICYALALVIGAIMSGRGIGGLSAVMHRLVPLEFLSSVPLDGESLVAASFSGAAVCVILSPALRSVTRGSGLSALLYLWIFAFLGGPAVDRTMILPKVFGGEVLLSLPVRLQIISFAAGMALSSLRRPTGLEQVCVGLAAGIALVGVGLFHLPVDLLHAMYRGALLPLQLLLVWAVAPLASVRWTTSAARRAAAGAGDECGPLGVSFAGILAPPAVAAAGMGQGIVGVASYLGVAILLHLAELAAWSVARACGLAAPGGTSRRPAKLHFLGIFADGEGRAWKMLMRALQRFLLAALLVAAAVTSYAMAHSRIMMQRDSGGLLSEFEMALKAFHMENYEYLCIPDEILYGSPFVKGFAWLIVFMGSFPVGLNLFGQVFWPAVVRREVATASKLNADAEDSPFVVIFRYCTRGNNPNLVKANVKLAHAALSASGMDADRWRIEVVTDNRIGLVEDCPDVPVVETCVPTDYRCPNGGKFKARAMHYAIRNSKLCPTSVDWICHLDEETRFDAHAVCGIFEHCLNQNRHVRQRQEELGEEEEGQTIFPDMGQGVILYNTNGVSLETHLTALADTARVGDDLGKFRLQYCALKRAAIGMHGSFAVINQGVEAAVGFDHGEAGSITEDSYFACQADSDIHVGVRWIDAFMYEQSPFTGMDLIRQRARWFHGLWHCTPFANSELPLRSNWIITYFVISWMSLWLFFVVKTIYTMSCGTDYSLALVLNVLGEVFRINYILGFVVNYSPYREGWTRWFVLLVMQITLLLLPIGCLELGGVMHGMYLVVSKNQQFYVVQKEKAQDKLEPGNSEAGELSSLDSLTDGESSLL